MHRFATLVTGFVLLATVAFGQDIRYVNGGTGTDSGNCTVNPCATITYAITQANSGDIVQIANGVYTESFAIDKSLTLQGQSQAATIIQAHANEGTATSRVITIDGAFEIEIADVTIRHGVAAGATLDGIGGGLSSQGGLVTLLNVTFRHNTALVGGGMASLEGSAILTNVTFSQNRAIEQGSSGGIAGGMANSNNVVTLNNVIFSSNHADLQGGGIVNIANAATLQEVAFAQNTANGYGGAMYNWNVNASLSGVTIARNNAPWGAGMYNIDSNDITKITIINSFIENNSGVYGGGMYNNTVSTLELDSVTLSGNTSLNGGGMYNDNTSPDVMRVHFIGNSGGWGGGGMYNNSGSSPTLVDVSFSGNTTTRQGGGMYNQGDYTSLTNVVFDGNMSTVGGTTGSGGGMVNQGNFVTFTNVTFTENSARIGGGLHNSGSGPSLTGVVFDSNNANTAGGMYNSGAFPELVNVTFQGNAAIPGTVGSGGGFAGGMYNAGGSPILSGVIFTANIAEDGAGGMMNAGGVPTLSGVTFIGNKSTGTSLGDGGGAMRNNNSSVFITDVEFIDNESARNSGGLDHTGGSLNLTNVTFSGNISTAATSGYGGGIRMTGAEAVFTNVTFLENEALSGGGMHISESSLMYTNGILKGNTNGNNGTSRRGGGMWMSGGSASLINTAFLHNEAYSGGGLLVQGGGSVTLTNATFSGNSATFSGGALYSQGSIELHNTILWGNTAGSNGNEIFNTNLDTPIHLFYSLYSDEQGDMYGDFEIENSLTVDPLFADVANGDLRLQETSPAVNAGDPATDLSLFPGGPGSPVDLDGNPRVRDNRIDIGAYELQAGDYPAPENDNIADAIGIPVENATYEGSNVGATLEDGEPDPSCAASGWTTDFSVWWTFTAEENGRVTIHTNGSQTPDGDGLDTVLSLHSAADLLEIACDDDGGDGTQSFIYEAPIIKDEAYLIRVASYKESSFNQGMIQLEVEFHTVNDEPDPDVLVTTLSAPSPNPVRRTATLSLTVDREQNVTVEVFDMMGRRVQTLFAGEVVARQVVPLQLDTSTLSAGVYVIRAIGDRFVEVQKVTVVK